MFGMLMSLTTKSNFCAFSMLQRDRAVFGLFGVVAAHLLEQAAHDAAHGGEVVDDQEFQVGGVLMAASSRVGCDRADRRYRAGRASAELRRPRRAVVGAGVGARSAVRKKRSSASRFITMMLMRRFAGRERVGALERHAASQALHAQHAVVGQAAGDQLAARRVGAVGRQLPVAVAALARREGAASVWPSSVSRFGTSASTRADLAQQLAHVGLARRRCRWRTSAGSARRRSGCAGRRASCPAGSAASVGASFGLAAIFSSTLRFRSSRRATSARACSAFSACRLTVLRSASTSPRLTWPVGARQVLRRRP